MTSYDKLEQIRVNASGWLLKSDWIPVFLDVLRVSVVWCYASRQTNRHQSAWLDLQMKEPNACLGGFGFHDTVVAKLEPHSQAFLKKKVGQQGQAPKWNMTSNDKIIIYSNCLLYVLLIEFK